MIARVGLGAVLLLAAALRLWRLDQNGFDNEYYAAAVRSMAASAHAFLYNAFDPAGFVSVDKPPVALWVQVLSAKLIGFSCLSVLLPQVLEGVASVWLVHHLVRRAFGVPAGLLAALFLALTPVSVAVDRSGNTESCLALVLLLAAWALLKAAEAGSRRHLLLAMALIGLGFNVKMLAAWVVLPTFALVYLIGAPLARRRRIADLALGGAVLVLVSAPWVLAYDLTPADRRPFAGSSAHNSMVELAVGHNAIGRFVRLTGAPRQTRGDAAPSGETARAVADGADTAPRLGGLARLFVRAPVGPLRLADGLLAAQVEWLFPLALLGLVAGALDGRLRRPIGAAHLAVGLFAGWAITYAAVYSWAGGIFHFYYLSTMAPPLAALAGIGVAWLWRSYGRDDARALCLPVALLLTAAWQVYVEAQTLGWRAGRVPALMTVLFPAGDWRAGLHIALLAGVVVAAGWTLALALLGARRHVTRAFALPALGVGVAALLVLPAAWSLSAVLVKGIAVLPSADLVRLAPGALTSESRARAQGAVAASTAALIDFLARQRQGERYLLATSSTRAAAPIILETGEPVMALGGFHGLDQILTPADLARRVEAHQVRFVMLGDLSPISERMGGDAALAPMADWVRANGALVDPALWRPDGRRRGRTADWQLYDLRPAPAGSAAPGATSRPR